jgi:hypothetical protein
VFAGHDRSIREGVGDQHTRRAAGEGTRRARADGERVVVGEDLDAPGELAGHVVEGIEQCLARRTGGEEVILRGEGERDIEGWIALLRRSVGASYVCQRENVDASVDASGDTSSSISAPCGVTRSPRAIGSPLAPASTVHGTSRPRARIAWRSCLDDGWLRSCAVKASTRW